MKSRRMAAAYVAFALAATLLPAFAGSAFAAGTDWYVATAGNNSNDCLSTATPCATIAGAVGKAASGDTIHVAAGSYATGANLNKSLTLLGEQAGVDARDGRPGAMETVITGGGLGIFTLNATDITFDGFKFTNLKGRTLDTYFDADNFTMRNTILEGSSIDPGYNTGGIQFGGGTNLHANGLVFENNLVTADNGQLFYMGHAMDHGTIRNNLFNGDSVAFGPFGNRTGWLIEGNEFDGDVPGHGQYWGFGFNSNLGDVVIRDNYVHDMLVGIGQISVVGGEIYGNTFEDNAYAAFQLWGGEYGSPVSDDASIHNNLIEYNGTACTGFGDASHGIRLRPAGDASTIHMNLNAFIDLGVGACGEAWAIRQNYTGTADAETNWWGISGPAAAIAAKSGQGDVDFTPWIASYTDDPAHAGDYGFWPIIGQLGPTPNDTKGDALSQLQALLPTGDKHDDHELGKAIKHLERSLDADLWVDSSHLDAKHGNKVFDEEKDAIKHLDKVDSVDVSAQMDALVGVDHDLAQTAIDDARSAPIVNPAKHADKVAREIDKANDELAKGDAKRIAGDLDKAIDHYGKAWDHAQKALKEAAKS